MSTESERARDHAAVDREFLAGSQSTTSAQDRLARDLGAFLEFSAHGAWHQALRAASDACHTAPDKPEAHYAYGQAWLALGEPGRAEEAFAAALQLKPGWAEAWVNWGLARYRQGAIEDAKTAMRQALVAAPDHAAARTNLGAFLRITGAPETAEAPLRETLDRDPRSAGARLNLVADLLQEERPADALALLREVGPPAYDLRAARHWHLQEALALLQLDRPVEARVAIDVLAALGPVPAELAPLLAWRHVLLGLAERHLVRARGSAETMEAALGKMGPNAVLEHQIMARYDLAKFWSGQGEHPKAFAQWTAGHALLKPLQPFLRDAHQPMIDANIAAFTPARFATGARAKNVDPAPVFIVGMPRSGTTLIEQILAAHPQAHGAGERSALVTMAFRLGGGDDADAVKRLANLDQSTLDAAADAYLAELHALAPHKTRDAGNCRASCRRCAAAAPANASRSCARNDPGCSNRKAVVTTVTTVRTDSDSAAAAEVVCAAVAPIETAAAAAAAAATANTDGSFNVLYTAPAKITSASDSVTYTITDLPSNAAAYGSAIVPLDPGPTAANGTISVVHGTSVNETAYLQSLVTPGLTGDKETIVAVTGPDVMLTNGVVTYTAPASGTDSFKYTVQDQYGDQATGTVNANVLVAPTIGGTKAGQTTTSEAAVKPFANATITDPNDGGTDNNTLKISYTAANGTLSGTGISGSSGNYTLTGTAATITSNLEKLVFTPIDGVANTSLATSFTLTDTSAGGNATDSTTTLKDSDPAVAPTIMGTVAGQITGVAKPIAPFAGVTITDANNGTTDSATITLSGGGTLTDGAGFNGLTSTAGVYKIAATSAASLNKEIDALVFTPAVSPTHSVATTSFTLVDTTTAMTSTSNATTSVKVDPGPTVGAISSTIKLGASVDLTSAILSAAAPGISGDKLTITADSSTGTLGTLSLVNGDLVYSATGTGLSHIPANGSVVDSFMYTVSDQYGDTATATAKITVSNPATVINGPFFGFSTIQGTSGADIINASGFFNTIYDNGGNDVVNAGLSNATVYNGGGDVVTNLDGFFNNVSGGDGNDTVSGSDGITSVTLGNGNDNVSTDGFSNTINLGNGNDVVSAGQGLSQVNVGNGNDTIAIAGSSNVVTAGNGSDNVTGGAGFNAIALGNGKNSIATAGYGNQINVGSGTNTIAVANGGQSTITAGAGTDTIALSGTNNSVTLNGSTAVVSGGQGSDSVTANGGKDALTFAGSNDQATLNGTTTASIMDLGNALRINIGSSTQTDTISGFGSKDNSGVIDLQNHAGGFTSVSQVIAALHSDGAGGTMLALGTTGSIDFAGTAASQLHASNFKIG